MPDEARHPAILAKDLHISDLVLRHIHAVTGHGGRNHMLLRLHQKYWIPGASIATLSDFVKVHCVSKVTCCTRTAVDGRSFL